MGDSTRNAKESRVDKASFPLFIPTTSHFFVSVTKVGDEDQDELETKVIGQPIVPEHSSSLNDCWVCWYDTEEIPKTADRKSLPIGLKRDTTKSSSFKTENLTYKFMGCFCSWECVWAFDSKEFKGAHRNFIVTARKDIDGVCMTVPLRKHPVPWVLEKFGGTVSLFEYRNWWNLPISRTFRDRKPLDPNQQIEQKILARSPNARCVYRMLQTFEPDYTYVLDCNWKITCSNVIVLNEQRKVMVEIKPLVEPPKFKVESHSCSNAIQTRVDDILPTPIKIITQPPQPTQKPTPVPIFETIDYVQQIGKRKQTFVDAPSPKRIEISEGVSMSSAARRLAQKSATAKVVNLGKQVRNRIPTIKE